MKIRAIVAAIALFGAVSACASKPGTPTAADESAAVESAAGAASDGGGGGSAMDDDTATDDGGAMDSDTATDDSSDADADQGAVDQGDVDQGGIDQPGADDTDSDDPDAPGDPVFCKQLVSAEDQLDQINQAFSAGDMTTASKTLSADMDVFKKLADSAPSHIQPAMQDIITALAAAQKALGGSAPDPSAMAGLTTMGGDLAALGTYLATSCADYMGG